MLKKALAFGILSSTLFGVMALPAQADTATVQTVYDDIYIEGYDNTLRSSTEQESYIRGKNVRRDRSTATVQDVYRRSTVVGEGNQVDIRSEQRSMTKETYRRPSKRTGRY